MLTQDSFKKENLPDNALKSREHLLNYKEVISDFHTEIKFDNDEHIGSYRLSKELLNKIMFNTGKEAITKTELAVLIMLLQICDNKNLVEDLHYQELIRKNSNGKNNISIKSFYNAISGLKDKDIIDYQETRGYRTIHILHNNIKKKERYLYLNFNIFCPGTQDYEAYTALPLGAQKLALYLLCYGHPKFGYTVNLDELRSDMGYKSVYLLHRYIKLMEPLFGKIELKKNVHDRKKNLNIHPSIFNSLRMVPKNNMNENQLTYFRRKMLCLLKNYNIGNGDPLYGVSIPVMIAEFFKFLKNNIKHGPENIFKVIEYSIVTQGELNFRSLHDAMYIVANA